MKKILFVILFAMTAQAQITRSYNKLNLPKDTAEFYRVKTHIDTSDDRWTQREYFVQGTCGSLIGGSINATELYEGWNRVWHKGNFPIYYNTTGDDSCYIAAILQLIKLRVPLAVIDSVIGNMSISGRLSTYQSVFVKGKSTTGLSGVGILLNWDNTYGNIIAYDYGSVKYKPVRINSYAVFSPADSAKLTITGKLRVTDTTTLSVIKSDNSLTFGSTYSGTPIRTIYMQDSARDFSVGDTTWIYGAYPNVDHNFVYPANYFNGKKRWIFKFNINASNTQVYIKYYSVSGGNWIDQTMESTLTGKVEYILSRHSSTEISLLNGSNENYYYSFPGTTMSDQLQFKIYAIASSGGGGDVKYATIEIQEAP